MAWDYDKPPIEYLEQRVAYYKKKYNRLPRTYRKSEILRSKYSEVDVVNAMENIKIKIAKFEEAITILRMMEEPIA